MNFIPYFKNVDCSYSEQYNNKDSLFCSSCNRNLALITKDNFDKNRKPILRFKEEK